MLKFYWKWIEVSVKPSFGLADGIGFVLGIAIPVVIHFVPRWETAMSNLAWQIPLGIFSTIFLIRLILAPYWIYKQQEVEISGLEGKLASLQNELEEERNQRKPILTLVSPINAAILWDETNKKVMARINLPIVNQGNKPAYQLHVRCCYASVETPSDIHIATDQTIPNAIFSGQPFSFPFVTAPKEYRNFGKGMPPNIIGGSLLVYCSLQYSDAPTEGRLSRNEWWLTYGWVVEQLAFSLQREVDSFEPFVRKLWGNVALHQ